MKKENRLRKNWQFQQIIAKKKQIVTKYLVVYFVPNDLNTIRVGISVSKKFANAVERNRQRRQTRAALDILKTEYFNSGKSYDIVIMLRTPFLDASFEKKTIALQEIIKQLN